MHPILSPSDFSFSLNSLTPPADTVTAQNISLPRYHGTVLFDSSFEKARFRFDQGDRSTTWSPQCHHLAFHERWAYDKGRRLAFVMQRHTLTSRYWTLEFGCSSLAFDLSASGMSADAPCAASSSSSVLLFALSSSNSPHLAWLPLSAARSCVRGCAGRRRCHFISLESANYRCVSADDVGLSSRLRHHVGCGT